MALDCIDADLIRNVAKHIPSGIDTRDWKRMYCAFMVLQRFCHNIALLAKRLCIMTSTLVYNRCEYVKLLEGL